MVQGYPRIEFASNKAFKGSMVDTAGRLQHCSMFFVASTKWATRYLKTLFRVPEGTRDVSRLSEALLISREVFEKKRSCILMDDCCVAVQFLSWM
jgi:hypothetical protein